MPFIWLSYPFKNLTLLQKVATTVAILCVMTLVALVLVFFYIDPVIRTFITTLILIAILLIVMIALIIGIIAGLVWVNEEYWPESKLHKNLTEVVTMIKGKKDATMNKYCPKIEWYD